MIVTGNKIVKIEESDIVNGTFKLPKGVTTIGKNACMNISALTTLPDGIVTVEDHAFYECTALKKMPNSIKKIGRFAFAGCTSLENISDGITTVEYYAFYECTALKKMPNSIKKIGRFAFAGCTSLTNISNGITEVGDRAFYQCTALKRMPNSITTIGESAFYGCTSLTNISDGITEVGDRAFYQCTALKRMPNSIKKIGRSAFEGCTSLTNISDGITTVESFVFYKCTALKTIHIKEIDKMAKSAFGDTQIQKIITPYGEMKLKESSSQSIITTYLYLYANSILKEKYQNIEEFTDNHYIYGILDDDIIFKEGAVKKFRNLYFKMRKTWDIGSYLFQNMSLGLTEKFDLKVWNQIKNLRALTNTIEMSKAFAEMMEVFGVFEKDSKQEKRIKDFKNFVVERPFVLTEIQYEFFVETSMPRTGKCIEDLFKTVLSHQYECKENVQIPDEFSIYLKEEMDEKVIPIIKKLSGHYGKQINDFVKENYEQVETRKYVLKEEGYQDKFFQEDIFHTLLNGHVNYSTLHQIFDGCTGEFNEDFYEFFMGNLPIILQDEKIQAYVKEIQTRFLEIQDHYAYTSGTPKIHLKQAIDYVQNIQFDYHPGNEEVAMKIQAAGVVNKEAFEYYQTAFEKNQKRRRSSLVKRKNAYEIDGYVIEAELLRKDEIEGALVGEVNHTNCCQVYGGTGHNCMAHAVYSDDGGVFTIKLIQNGKEILLTQSWDWQNNNVYCHDNIEGTPYLKENPELQAVVAKAFQLDGEEIIKKSKDEIESYIKTRRKTIEKSLTKEEEKQQAFKELREIEERQVIRVVTSGAGNSDLKFSNYFSSSIQVNESLFIGGQTYTLANFQPVEYNSRQIYFDNQHSAYTDSGEKQYIIAGSLEDLCLGKQEPLVPIYRDERRVLLEKEEIRDYTFHKIQTIEKEAYPEDMQQHQNTGRDEFTEEYGNVYLGEDWYMLYEEKDERTIYIADIARVEPDLEDEKKEQLDEMNEAILSLLEEYEVIEADLKEDTSYLLYLINKKRGLIEQIGKDESYLFEEEDKRKIVSQEEQEKFLRNIRQIRESENPDFAMHYVTFKKGKRWKNNSSIPISRKR